MRSEDLGRGLYIITTDEGFPCKVGITNDLQTRVGALQIGNWNRLRASWFTFVLGPHWRSRSLNIWAAFSNAAEPFETAVHRKMSDLDLHLSGEWFAISESDCRLVIEKVAKDEGFRLSGIEMLEGVKNYSALPARSLAYLQALLAAEESAQAAIAAGITRRTAIDAG